MQPQNTTHRDLLATQPQHVQRDLLPAQLSRVNLPPALVMSGDQDKLAFEGDAHDLATALGAEVHIIAGSGHDAMLDSEWRQFASRLCRFVEMLPEFEAGDQAVLPTTAVPAAVQAVPS
jgi:pimeloyl-ACP methyl ester carboxylesterase